MCSEGFPFGSEGCGIIERVGSDINPDLIGTTVSFLEKAWSKYCIQPLRMCMIWPRKIDSKTGAMAMLNPLNILGLLDIIK
jgi:NADPH:quinone reductase-like Zn-dependent oxidoreductase